MKDQQITLFDIQETCDFIQLHGGNELYEKFLVLLDEAFKKLPATPNAVVNRFTNDAAVIHGLCDELARRDGILALPLRKGIYFFNILEIPGHTPGEKMEVGKAFIAFAKVFIVIDFEKMTIEDQTHNLKD